MAWEKYISLPSQALKIKIESLFPDKSCLDDFNFTSLHQLVIGLRAGDLLSELRRSPCLTDATDAGGNTALLWAIKSSDLNAAEILLGHGADPNICDKFRRSPLHYAGRCAEPRLITRLIECGADIHKKSKWGSSALHFACVQGGDEIAFSKLLLDAGLELEAMNDQNRTVLSEAAKYDRKNMATFLLERGANLNVESTKGETPLMEAVIHNSSRCLSLFLSKDGPYENQSKRGNSILHLAALTGTLATLNILTQAKLRGIDIHARNVNGLTAMEIACERESSRNRRPEGFLGTFENLVLSMRDVSTTGEQKDPDNDSDVDPTEVFTDAPEF
jgi:ankyrin repeat protein